MLFAVVLRILHFNFSWLIALIGGLLICAAAFINGKRSKNFHSIHHIIRLGVTLILTIGFIFF